MDDAQLQRLVESQAKTSVGFPTTANLSGLVENAVALAGPYVWKSYEWSFKRKERTISTVASQEHIVLPEDFGSLLHFNFKQDTTRGWNIRYMEEDRYDLAFPNPLVLAKGYPRACKVVKDNETGRWRAYFSPVPDAAYSLDFGYSIEGGSIDAFPSGFEDVLLSAAWLFMFSPGSQGNAGARRAFNEARGMAIDTVDQQHQQRTSTIRRSSRFRHGDGYGDQSPDDWVNVVDGSDY